MCVCVSSVVCSAGSIGKQYVLGISSGGFSAVQYHVAFSSEVSGAGIFAAGPFFCAQGTITAGQQ